MKRFVTHCLVQVCVALACAAAEPHARVTLRDLLEMPKVITGYDEPILLSPDGGKYAFVLCRGDVARNGSWVEFYIGSTNSIERAQPHLVARQFTTSNAFALDFVQLLRWTADGKSLVFL